MTETAVKSSNNSSRERRRAEEEAQRREHEQTQNQLQEQQDEIRRLQEQQRQQADGELLAAIQTELQALGHTPGTTDGVYTTETRQAIEYYQYLARLPITGLPSQELLRHLQETRRQIENPEFRDLVRQTETKLNALGYQAGSTDGVFTTETRAAVEAYQRDNGLLVDGVPTRQLLAHMGETVAELERAPGLDYKPGADQLSRKELVTEVQLNLAALEYDPGTLDGVFGVETSEAIMAFQVDQGLTPDGQPSGALLQRLQEVRARGENLAVAGRTVDLNNCTPGTITRGVGGEMVTEEVDICTQPDGSTVTLTR